MLNIEHHKGLYYFTKTIVARNYFTKTTVARNYFTKTIVARNQLRCFTHDNIHARTRHLPYNKISRDSTTKDTKWITYLNYVFGYTLQPNLHNFSIWESNNLPLEVHKTLAYILLVPLTKPTDISANTSHHHHALQC